MLPSTNEALSDTDYLSFCDEELKTYIVPLMMSTMEEYFVAVKDQTVTANISSYAIPYRAMGGNLRAVQFNPQGSSSSVYVDLPRIEPENESGYGYGGGGPCGYKLQNNSVVLIPAPSAAGTLRLQYFQRPNNLVATSAVGTITSINTGTNTVTCSNVPTSFTTALTYDLVKATPGFDLYAFDQAISARVTGASGTVTFSNTLPTGLAVGDYVCLATESPVAQIPYELHALLAQAVTATAQQALGDPRTPISMKSRDLMAERLMRMISPRSQGSARYILNKNGPGNSYYRYRRRGF